MSVFSGQRARLSVRAAAGAVTAVLVALSVPAHADPEIGPVVARFDLDEAPGSTTFSDHIGGLLGSIGYDVRPDGTGHVFATHMPDSGYHPGHVNVVPHSARSYQLLNPGTGSFQFTIRYNTSYSFGNIMQKGQGTQVGGYWKLENPNRQPRCLFRGGNGASRTGYWTGDKLSRGWHTITCVRTPQYVEMWVDGVRQRRMVGPTGDIRNTAPFSIGGKSSCNGGSISCDYFIGKIDFIEFRRG